MDFSEELLSSPAVVSRVLNEHDIHLKKSLGQNILIDKNIACKIIETAEVADDDIVLEVGPGLGSMTQILAGNAKKVVAVEIDERMVRLLNDMKTGSARVEVIHGDILELEPEDLYGKIPETGLKIVSNLPYNMATKIIVHLLQCYDIEIFVAMVQKEVAERLTADPGSKDYGSLSIIIEYLSHSSLEFSVPPTVFIPRPRVDSAVVKIEPRRKLPLHKADTKLFFRTVRAAFYQRRKTLRNSLSAGLQIKKAVIDDVLKEIDIDSRIRGEALSVDEFVELTKKLAAAEILN